MANCANCGTDLPPGARFCPGCAAPVEASAPSEERKLATVLFADLVGSTELAGSQDPERTRALLDRFYDGMAAEIARSGGTVEKYVGDAVMAVFGAPAALEDHAERALHAALAMRRRLEELFGGRLRLRIGVNTGEIVVGRAREGSSFVTGDAVNVCARLEQNVAPGEILVGERTAATVRGAFEFDEPTQIEAKGKTDGVACRRLVRALTLMRPRGVGGLRRAFVGRESELQLLQATYNRAVAEAEPHLVTIMGDAGVGKTRLVRELWDWLGGEPHEPLRRTGRCLPYGQGITYWALGEILKEHLGLLESDSPETVRSRLGERQILGLTLGLDVAGDLHPLAARDRLHDAWLELLTELAADRPSVLLVEDLHWAEEPLLNLLERIVREVQGPVLVVGTTRPELLDRRSAWGGGRRNTSTVWLEPLSAADAARMLDELLAADLPERLRDLVVERAEGNPFFLEELLATLIDQGVLERAEDGWRARELPQDFAIPDSVHGVLAARIDLLAPAEKAALQAAAVIGRVFWAGPVRELIEYDDPGFELLEERDFIRRRPGSSMAGDREYAIKHALTREVAYASLPRAKRARLHAAFAAWLERVADGRDELASLLAHHYAEAVRPEDADLAWAGEEQDLTELRGKAVAWLERAGELAIGRYEIEEALVLFDHAGTLEVDPRRRAELWRQIGLANALKYDGEAFWTAMQKSIETCFDRAICADTYSVLAFQTSLRAGMWRKRPDGELVDGWIRQALELTDPETPARARALIARANWHPAEGGEFAVEGSALADRLGDANLRSYAWGARSAVAFHARHYDESCTWAQRRFDLTDEISDPDHLVEMLETALPAVGALGRFREARRLAREHAELSSGLSNHHRVHAVALAAEAEELLGDWERIRELEDWIVEAVDANAGTPCVRNSRCLLLCAVARACAGEDDRSRELEQSADDLGMVGHSAPLDPPKIRLLLVRGELDEIDRLLEEESIVGRHRMTFGLPRVAARLDAAAALRRRDLAEAEGPLHLRGGTYLEPFALRALGIVRGDKELIEQAQQRFRAMKLDWHAAQTERLSSLAARYR